MIQAILPDEGQRIMEIIEDGGNLNQHNDIAKDFEFCRHHNTRSCDRYQFKRQ